VYAWSLDPLTLAAVFLGGGFSAAFLSSSMNSLQTLVCSLVKPETVRHNNNGKGPVLEQYKCKGPV